MRRSLPFSTDDHPNYDTLAERDHEREPGRGKAQVVTPPPVTKAQRVTAETITKAQLVALRDEPGATQGQVVIANCALMGVRRDARGIAASYWNAKVRS